ncbi:MAG: exo 1,3/1,4-beta-D-glucan glucohydrolase [Acidobacteriota bacterium]
MRLTIWNAVFGTATLLMLGCAGDSAQQGEASQAAAPAGPPTIEPANWPEIPPAVALDPEIEDKVSEIMQSMSLADKVGQVIQGEIRHVTAEDVRKYRLGSVLNGGGSHPGGDKHSTIADWVALADAYWEASMDTSDGGVAIPILWGSDAVHGHNNVIGATLFPHNVGLGAANNPELIRRIGEVTGIEVAVTGLDWTFGPTVAVPRDDRWGRTYEGYSEDPDIVRDYAGEVVRGLQGEAGADDWLAAERVLSTAKHFLGDGGTEKGMDQGENLASEAELRDIHAAGYTTALGAGVQTVMASFNSWHGKKMHGRGDLLTGVLKERMGFDGFVVGDWNGHGQVAGCTNDSCAASFNAGVDMFMVPEDWKALYENTIKQVESGEITQERLDDAVRRILRVKMRAGLFDRGKPSSRPFAGKTELIGAPEHREVARQAVRESLVLLKNAGSLLPLAPNGRVLVAGDGADDIGKQSGGWTITWQGTGNENADFPGATSIWDGIRQAVQGAGGTAELSEDGSFTDKPDVAIVVYGEDPYAEFQGDLDGLEYQAGNKRDLKLLRHLQAADVPVVSIFLSGRPLWVNPELNASDAFVAAWLPGTEGGGIADVLFRATDGSIGHDFKGKLSYSWPKSVTQNVLNRRQDGADPLFAYGHGLTYGDDGALADLSEDVPEAARASRKVYFAGGPVDPWTLYVGDEADGKLAVTGAEATSASDRLTLRSIDRRVQEDARAVAWSGGAAAEVYLQAAESIDISRESNGDLALAFDLRVDRAPAGTVTLRMDCGDGCSGSLDVTDELTTMPAAEWQTVRVRLRCFADAGADMTKIDTPFLIATDGELELAFSDVKLVSAAAGEAPCP